MPTMSDLLRGEPQYDTVGPTPRSPGWGFTADMLRKGRDIANKAELPLLGPVGDLILGKVPEEVNAWSYGDAPVRINPNAGRTASYVPEIKPGRKEQVFDTAMAFTGMPSTGRKAAVAALAGGIAPGPADIATYLAHTPLKPHPDVGSRFKREMVGDFVEKTPRKIEDVKGASITAMPWDQSSRGYSITHVSDEALPSPVLTTGGQDFARDAANVAAQTGGSSNKAIAKRIQDRNAQAMLENVEAGGSGRTFMLPSTMGGTAEYFSTMPTEVITQLLRNADLSKKNIKLLDQMVRNAPVKTPKGLRRPFGEFAGFNDPDFALQVQQGLGPGATAGMLRTAIAEQMTKKGQQKMLGYNAEDMMAALRDPALHGVDKGHVGNTLIETVPGTPLKPGTHPSYDTDFGGKYYGSFGANLPIEVAMPKVYAQILRELEAKGISGTPTQMRNNVIGAMEKRGKGFSELVDDQTIESVNRYLEGLRRGQ